MSFLESEKHVTDYKALSRLEGADLATPRINGRVTILTAGTQIQYQSQEVELNQVTNDTITAPDNSIRITQGLRSLDVYTG